MASKYDEDVKLTPPNKKKKHNDKNAEPETILLSDDDDDDDEMPPLIALSDDDTYSDTKTASSSTKNELVVLSWNIDGLDEREIQLRTVLGVVECIRVHLPDVVMLQEVVNENLSVLQQLCNKYNFTVHKVANYYNTIMTKKDKSLAQGENKHINFKNSTMGRFLLIQELIVSGTSFSILTTHLESCANSAGIRKEQLRTCFDTMKKYMEKSNVILSGDLNLRESEIKSLGGPPSGISDAWEACGSDINKRFTWDLKENDNLNFGSSKPRARYDRMYYSSLKDKGIKCSSFELVGKTRIEACGLFPSDHFGVLVKFTLQNT